MYDVAAIFQKLMHGLSYTSYISQGGDLGSFLSRLLGIQDPACTAVHLNLVWIAPRPGLPEPMPEEAAGLALAGAFKATGSAYSMMHATRPSTVAHVLSSSPIALLAWIGEKHLAWSDEPRPGVDAVVRAAALWWLTGTAASCLYPYREIFVGEGPAKMNLQFPGEELHLEVPLGFSMFPADITPCPKSWAACTGRMVFYRRHKSVSLCVRLGDLGWSLTVPRAGIGRRWRGRKRWRRT